MKVNVHWCQYWRALVWTLQLAAAVPLQPPAISYFHLQLKTLHCSTASFASCVSKLSNIEIFRHQGCFKNNIIPFATFFYKVYRDKKVYIFIIWPSVFYFAPRCHAITRFNLVKLWHLLFTHFLDIYYKRLMVGCCKIYISQFSSTLKPQEVRKSK